LTTTINGPTPNLPVGRSGHRPADIQNWNNCLPNKMTLRYTLNDPNLYGAKLLENIVQALARSW